jgi:UDP-galactopyranose mutase
MKHVDYLIVGSGLTGATIARMMHDAGREVLVIDRRQHLGGNDCAFTLTGRTISAHHHHSSGNGSTGLPTFSLSRQEC